MSRASAKRVEDSSLSVRAAWLHYAGGITQVEVARRLGISSATASRLIASAHESGAVKVSIVGGVAECIALEARIMKRFDLAGCEVVPDLDQEKLPVRALGEAGSRFLQKTIAEGDATLVGLGHGRTLAAAIDTMPPVDAGSMRFVSLLGGVTRNFAANPHDVMFRLARKTGAASYILPVPFFANTEQDRTVLLSQRGVRDVYELALSAELMVVGIGTAQLDAQLVASQMIEAEEIAEVRRAGGVGELLGHFFDAAGGVVTTSLSGRTISPDLTHLKGRRVVALAGGCEKVDAIRSVLMSGYVTSLIVDERTAGALLEGEETQG